MMPSEQPQQTDPPALETALRFLRAGFWPVAIHPGEKRPIGERWGARRPTEATLRAMWARNPGAGVGLKLGCDAGLIDIEIDDRETGESTLSDLFGGEVVATLGWSSRRGRHRAFQYDPRLARWGKTIVHVGGVEIRIGCLTPGGPQLQSVIPPTIDDEGNPRTWNGVETIAEMSDRFFAEVDRRLTQRNGQTERGPRPGPGFVVPPVPEFGEWTLEQRAIAYLDRCEPAISGQHGHDKTFGVACRVGPGFEMGEEETVRLLMAHWNPRCVPPWTEKDIRHKVADAFRVEPARGWLKNAEREGGTQKTQKTQKGGRSSEGVNAYSAFNASGTSIPRGSERLSASNAFNASAALIIEEPVHHREWPAPPEEPAWIGPAGKLARAVAPHTEADPVAILVQILAGFGNILGRSVYWRVGATKHYCNLFVATVGPTSLGRKGTAWDEARRGIAASDPGWADHCIKGGLSSGEGLIWAVRDPIFKREPIREKGRVVDYQEIEADPGIADKRLLVVESELAGTFKVMVRESNTLSALVRQAWDSGDLRTMTKNSPAVATGAHISIIGHITEVEVNRHLSEMEAANGFGNRFLWASVRQSQLLPFGGEVEAETLEPILDGFRAALAQHVETVKTIGPYQVHRDPDTADLWRSFYSEVNRGRPGLMGALTGRAAPMTMRLAVIYALLDGAFTVGCRHLEAAIAVWRYSERSASYIFGESMGDPDADTVLDAIRSAEHGLTQTQIYSDLFQRNKSAKAIARILGRLQEANLVRSEVTPTGGRPVTTWFSKGLTQETHDTQKAPSETRVEEEEPTQETHDTQKAPSETRVEEEESTQETYDTQKAGPDSDELSS